MEFNPQMQLAGLLEWMHERMEACYGKTAVIGISGGKDSSTVAALAVAAYGRENVFGVLMPNGVQPDIDYSQALVEHLNIPHTTINIHDAVEGVLNELRRAGIEPSRQTTVNLPSRVRMATLYAVAQSLPGGTVINTSNLSEDWVGYCTIYGDSAGAFSPLGRYTTEEVIALGQSGGLVLPEQRVQGGEALTVGALEVGAVDALRRAEGQHDVLEVTGQCFLRLGFGQQELTGYVAVYIPDVGEAHAAQVGVRARAEAGVLVHVPVFQVVAGGEAGPGEVGDLVLLIAVLGQGVHGGEVHLRLLVIVGERLLLPAEVEGRALLQLQAVAADVLGVEGQHLRQRVQPLIQRLTRQAVDQVHAQVADAGLADGLGRLFDLVEGVDAPDAAQQRVVGGLDAQGDAVHPGAAQGTQGLYIAGGVRVGLHGDLRVTAEAVAFADGREDGLEAGCAQVGGRAAADIHRVYQMGGGLGGDLLQMAHQGGGVSVHFLLAVGQGVKIAVAAFLPAEGDVDVQPQRLRGGPGHSRTRGGSMVTAS